MSQSTGPSPHFYETDVIPFVSLMFGFCSGRELAGRIVRDAGFVRIEKKRELVGK